MYEGRDEVRAGEGHQEHDNREHGEEPRGGKVGFRFSCLAMKVCARRDNGEENDDDDDEHP